MTRLAESLKQELVDPAKPVSSRVASNRLRRDGRRLLGLGHGNNARQHVGRSTRAQPSRAG
eukprot:7012165-Lingulodinium_polyedra.AAC.1